MQHYLRMLAYARKPESDWGSARRVHRYASENQNTTMTTKNDQLSAIENDQTINPKSIINETFDSQYDGSARS